MNETQPAKFALVNYFFDDFSFRKPKEEGDVSMSVNFKPSGIFFQKQGKFELKILVACTAEGNKEPYITASLNSEFHITENNNTIPDFFYRNSIAIIFPYIRAFISTLTLQANDGMVMLPTLNLSNLEGTLRENTTVIEE